MELVHSLLSSMTQSESAASEEGQNITQGAVS